MNDQIEIKDLQQGTPELTDWLVFQEADGDNIVYKAPKSDIEGEDAFVYIGYADDDIGTGFTLTFDSSKDYIAFKSTNVEIPNPVVGDFAGLWKKYKGEHGDAATIQVGTVTTVDPGDPATVVNSGDEYDAIFDFEIPQGDKGDTGAQVASVAFSGDDIVFTLTDATTVTLTGAKTILTGPKGDTGASIVSATFVGNDLVFTKDDNTTVTLVGAKTSLKGDKGDTGDTGNGIASIDKTGTVGLVDTYTITYTDATTDTFDITNGKDITWKGAYSGATSYVVNDAVSYNGSSYICILPSLNNLPTNTTYWNLLAQRGQDGEGSGDMLASIYDPAGGERQVAFLDQLPDITTKWTKGGDTIGAKKLLGSIDNQSMGLITNNLERLTILENGNVGIGTTSPAVNFTIKQGTDEYAQLNTAFDMALGIASNSTKITGLDFKNFETKGQTRLMARNNANAYIAMNAMGETNSNTFFEQAGNQMLLFSSGSRMAVGTHSSHPLILGTYNTEKMRISSDGNVGIGTTTPQAKLDISAGNLDLDNTTNANQFGVISKNGTRFIHDFNYGDNGTVTTEGRNTFIGINSGNLTMGLTATTAGQSSYNTGVGYGTLQANTTGNNNSALGFQSLYSNTTGYNNSAFGFASLYSNTTGYNNSAFGFASLYSNTTGNYNSAQGYASLFSNTTGNYNSAQGMYSLYYNTTGNYNSALGYQAGRYISDGTTGRTTGNYGLYLGFNTKASDQATTNEIVIGYDATGQGSNTIQLGNSSILRTYAKGLNLGAGTATAGTAPLKLTSGTLNTTAEAGAIEFLTDRYYATITTGAERKTLAFTSDIVSQVEDSIVDGHTTIAPSGNAVFDALAGKQDALGFTPEDVANKRTSFQVTPDDTHYPSEKLVKDSLDAKMANPMTTQGDVIYGGSSGLPTRLAKGTAGQVLTMNAGATAPEWQNSLSKIAPQQTIPMSVDYLSNSTNAIYSSDGNYLYMGWQSGDSYNGIWRFTKDQKTGLYVYTDSVSLYSTYACKYIDAPVIIGNYIYVTSHYSSDKRITRLNLDLTSPVIMTIGVADIVVGQAFTDGTYMYVFGSTNIATKYSISGTTMTKEGTITFTSAGNVTSCFYYNGYVYTTSENSKSTYLSMSKYNISGGTKISSLSLNNTSLGGVYAGGEYNRLGIISNEGLLVIGFKNKEFETGSSSAITGYTFEFKIITMPSF